MAVVGKAVMTLLCKRTIVTKSKEVKTGCNLAGPSEDGHNSKRAVLPMVMMNYRQTCKIAL
jgi:hypothetical protein